MKPRSTLSSPATGSSRRWLIMSLLLPVAVACATAGAAKDERDAVGRLAEREADLRESLDRQYTLQVQLRRAQDELERAQADLRLTGERLRGLVSVKAELEAEKEQHVKARAALNEAQDKLNSIILSPKAQLVEQLRSCRQSIPKEIDAEHNRTLAGVFRSLRIRGEPRVVNGMLSDDHYIYFELTIAGERLWEHTVKTESAESPLTQTFSTISNFAGISSALRGMKVP